MIIMTMVVKEVIAVSDMTVNMVRDQEVEPFYKEFLNWVGVWFVNFLKAVLKDDFELNPASNITSRTVSFSSFESRNKF